ncbi:hypothetical protein HZF08_27095 [Paenibacillus sp. CGMCC 1.16610]|nr:hypothetical protein [Paenibacillus sp. CGMCC 1.16610]
MIIMRMIIIFVSNSIHYGADCQGTIGEIGMGIKRGVGLTAVIRRLPNACR